MGTELNWKTRMDIIVWLVGFGATIKYGALQGILYAVFLSLFIIIYQVVNPDIQVLGYKEITQTIPGEERKLVRKWCSMPREGALEEKGILVFRFEGPLFYANVEQLHEWLEKEELKRTEETGDKLQAIIF